MARIWRNAFFPTAVFLALVGGDVGAQQTSLRPLSENLERIREDPNWLLLATRRCSALYSLVAAARRGRGDLETADMYAGWSIGFQIRALGLANELASESGWKVQDVREVNEASIAQTESRLGERLERAGDFGRDPLLSSDFRTCRGLVDELGLQVRSD